MNNTSESTKEVQEIVNDQSGQTFVEFVLLLASIVIVAFSFMRVTNKNIADKWTAVAQVILDDDTQQLKPK